MSGKEPVKVVVRLLPPEITEAELLATVDEKHKQHAKWISFIAGKRYKGEAKPCLNARCYLQFESLGQSEEFIRDYHGHQFVDGQGENFRAVACIAPYQKVPRAKVQKDTREGTIEDDPLYKEFVEALANKATFEAPQDPKQALRPATAGDTPLLQYMKVRAEERRARAEKRRQDREKWRPSGGWIEEDPKGKKPRYHCKECGTTKCLEEDPDERGVFYCTPCWEYWESEEAEKTKKKKKKKKKKDEEEEWPEEEEAEPEESSSKKKKKKKKKKAEEEEEWWEEEATEDWAEDGASKKKKKKKKKKEEEDDGWYEEESSTNRWKKKKKSEEWSEDWKGWQEEKPSKSKSKKKKEDEWWEEEKSEEKSKSGRRKKNKGEDTGGGGRWVAKT